MATKKQIGEILVRRNAISAADLERALTRPKSAGRLASRLAAEGLINERDALKALSEQHGLPGIDLEQVCIKLEGLELVPKEIAVEQLILPILVRPDRLFVAMANPDEQRLVDELEFVTGKKVFPYVALAGPLATVIAKCFELKASGEEYFVGEMCPPEMLTKIGLEPAGRVSIPPPLATSPPPAEAARQAGRRTADATAFYDDEAPPEEFDPSSERPGDLHAVRRDVGRSFTPLPRANASAPSVPTPLSPEAVVLDDAGMGLLDQDIGDEGFGDLSPELSVVADFSGAPRGNPDRRKTVLVVDDEREIRDLVRKLLESRGYHVIEADRGGAALRMVKEQCPDLLVLDAMLPEVHGFDIARQINGSERYGHVPIIMISAIYRGWRFAEDLRESCGVEHYIEKPFSMRELLDAVESALAPKPRPSESAADGDSLSKEAEQALGAGVAAYRSGRLDDAIAHLQRGVQIDPLAFRLHFHLGLLYGKNKQVYDAIAELESAARINGRHFQTVKNLAILYQKAGFRNKAAEMWERGLTLAPDDSTRQSVKQHLLGLL